MTWENMSEKDFESLLEDSFSDVPPSDVIDRVTPWKKSMTRVLTGFAMTAITINLWYLNYILPAIGTVLQLLGFRTLRKENVWFKGCFVISVIRAAYLFPSLVLGTTIINSLINRHAVNFALSAVNIILQLAGFFCLWMGFISVQKKAGIPPHAKGALALIIWYILMLLLALVRYEGLILAGAMIVSYVFIIRSLFRLSDELNEAGYAIEAAPVKVTDKAVTICIVTFIVAGGTLGYLFGGSYPMKWTAVTPAGHSVVEDIKNDLLELGFPEYVLNDMTYEDIKACQGAVRVAVSSYDHPVNDGRRVKTVTRTGNVTNIHTETVFDVNELRITGVGVQIQGERETWIIIHHFLWLVDPGFYGTECVQIWPTYVGISEGWSPAGQVSGRVLYDKDDKAFAADYYFLGTKNYVNENIFWGSQDNTDIFAAFSMPKNGENYRGYVAYPVIKNNDGYIINSWFNYTHQKSFLQYPATTAMDRRMINDWFSRGPFKTVQTALQFYPTEEELEMIE